MSDWTKNIENAHADTEETWNSEHYGDIVKINGQYHALVPQTFVLGPFDTLKETQRQVLLNYDVMLKLTQNFTPEMLKYIENIRAGEK